MSSLSGGGEVDRPNVSYVDENGNIFYNPIKGKILYETTDGKPITISDTMHFYSNLDESNECIVESNNYTNGIGELVFDKPLVAINGFFIYPEGLKLKSATLFSPLKKIKDSFNKASAEANVILPDTLECMDSVFEQCLMPVVTIPKNVKQMQFILNYANDITTVIMKPITPPSNDEQYNVFDDGIPKLIYVPDDSVEAYKAAKGWENVKGKIMPMSEYNG